MERLIILMAMLKAEEAKRTISYATYSLEDSAGRLYHGSNSLRWGGTGMLLDKMLLYLPTQDDLVMRRILTQEMNT